MSNYPYIQQSRIYQKHLPNSTAVLVLGIISIVFCCAFGVIGLANGIIALVLASKSKVLYQAEPELYTMASYNNLKAGKICATVGICLSALALVFYLAYFVIIGTYIGIILAFLGFIAQSG